MTLLIGIHNGMANGLSVSISVGLAQHGDDRYRPGAPGWHGGPGDPGKGEKPMKLIPLTAIFTALAFVPAALRAQAMLSPPDPALVQEEFAVPRGGDVLVLPVTIGGTRHWFALYTGSSNSVFDKSLRGFMGEPLGAGGASTGDDSLPVELFAWPKNVRMGQMPVWSSQPVVLADLSSVRRSTGYDIDGLLGMDFLRAQIVRVDFDAGRLWFLRDVSGENGRRLPLTFAKSGLPSVSVDLGDGSQDCVVNTGSTGPQDGELTSAIMDLLLVRGRARAYDDGGSAFTGGRDNARCAVLQSIRLAGFESRGLTFSEAPLNMLGLGYWSRFAITLDFREGMLYVAPGNHFERPSSPENLRVSLVRERGLTFVDSIKRGSLAEQSGLRSGDLILNVGGLPAGTSSIQALTAALGTSSSAVPVLVQRQGAIAVVEVTAR